MLIVNIKINCLFFLLLITWIWQGLTPTIILARVSMGSSFHDEKSLADATMMRFYPSNAESTSVIVNRRNIKKNHDIDISENFVDGSLRPEEVVEAI